MFVIITHIRGVLGISWPYIEGIHCISWAYIGHILGISWAYLGHLWHTLAYSGILWYILAYPGILWHTLAYSGILGHTLAYSGIPLHTPAYFGILWHTKAYSGLLGGLPNCFSPISAVKGLKITPNTRLLYVFRFFEGHCNLGNMISSGPKIVLKRALYEACQIVSRPSMQPKV